MRRLLLAALTGTFLAPFPASNLRTQASVPADSGRGIMEVMDLGESADYRVELDRTVEEIRSLAHEAGIEDPRGMLVLYPDSAGARVEAVPVETNVPKPVWQRALPVVDDFLERYPLGDRWCHILAFRLEEGAPAGQGATPGALAEGADRPPRLLNPKEIREKLGQALGNLSEQPPPAGEDTDLRRLELVLRLLVDEKGRVPAVLDVRSSGDLVPELHAPARAGRVRDHVREDARRLDRPGAHAAASHPACERLLFRLARLSRSSPAGATDSTGDTPSTRDAPIRPSA